MEALTNIKRLEEFLDAHPTADRFTNSYMLPDEMIEHIRKGSLFYLEQDNGLVLLLKKEGFYRIYYYLRDLNTEIKLHSDQALVQELIYRGPDHFPESEVNFWIKNGFQKYLQRDNYCLNANCLNQDALRSSLVELEIRSLYEMKEIDRADHLIRTYLDRYTGDILTKRELKIFGEQDDLIGIFLKGNLAGVLQAEFKNNVYWLGHMVVDQAHRGLNLSTHLLKAYLARGLELNCRQFQLWVIYDNSPALGLYHKYGFKFLNKSTISLLKN